MNEICKIGINLMHRYNARRTAAIIVCKFSTQQGIFSNSKSSFFFHEVCHPFIYLFLLSFLFYITSCYLISFYFISSHFILFYHTICRFSNKVSCLPFLFFSFYFSTNYQILIHFFIPCFIFFLSILIFLKLK